MYTIRVIERSHNKTEGGNLKVRDVLKRLNSEGWYQVEMEGSHRQFEHPTKPGKVTVAGHPSEDIAKGMFAKIRRQAGW
jgi:predicted RNA binding protein YcfA (HicA-like mRNA interferase family)